MNAPVRAIRPRNKALAQPAPAASRRRSRAARLTSDAAVIVMVWQRELLRFSRNRLRVLTALAQPALFLFLFGSGLAPAFQGGAATVDYQTFIFPGVLAMAVLFPAVFAAMTIVSDRQDGFLREMLVAPTGRWAVIVGKCLGGATIAGSQGLVILAVAPLVHVPYALLLLLVLAELTLTAIAVSATGLLVASRLGEIESFQVLIQLFVLPIFFLSGALFPLKRLPSWLGVLTRLDPLTYAVDAMRRAVFTIIHAPAAAVRDLNPGVTWNGWRVPTSVELALVAVFAAAMLVLAVRNFSRPD